MDREFLEGLGADSGLTPEAMDAILQQHGKEISRLRLEGTLKNAVLRFGGRNEKAIAAPTTNRKNGNTRSVGVHPAHLACANGGKMCPHEPGLFTRIIPATVIPLSTSSAT